MALFCSYMSFISYNGEIVDASLPVLHVHNRAFKYGDGVFETMRMWNGNILLQDLHFERLLNGLATMEIRNDRSFRETVVASIHQLCERNGCCSSAKVRVAAFREEAKGAGFSIEVTPLPHQYYQLNNEGWAIDVYPDVLKSGDVFANLKSANYLPYVMADLHARANELDESLVLNTRLFIADGSKTNVFIIKDQVVFTPALDQGCVAGVMRLFVINEMKNNAHNIRETEVSTEMLLNADEVFMTNAIKGIQWVKSFRNKVYGSTLTRQLFNTLFSSPR